MEPSLTGAEKRALRAQGQLLEAALRIGREGASPPVVRELEQLLTARELVKVRFEGADRNERASLTEALATATGSRCVGAVGHTALFYRPGTAGAAAGEQDV